MRFLKKRLNKLWLYLTNYRYIKENILIVKKFFSADSVSFASFGGADINFFVKKDKKVIGMMRLAIIDDNRKNKVHINRFKKEKRINKEISSYSIGFNKNLTPELLHSSKNFTVCRYIDGQNLNSFLKKNPEKILEILQKVLLLYRELHSLDIVHLDASLKNIFIDSNDKDKFKIVDFEYYAEDELNLKEQKLYDYLRIYEYSLRGFLSEDKIVLKSLELLDNVLLDGYNKMSLEKLRPLLNNLKKNFLIVDFFRKKDIKI